MMWGDAEGAYALSPKDKLAICLFEVTGPIHIPYNDSRWQQLLLHYEQLAHLHYHNSVSYPSHRSNDTGQLEFAKEEEDVVAYSCRRSAKYCSSSSNLATLSLHASRMIRDLKQSVVEFLQASVDNQNEMDLFRNIGAKGHNSGSKSNEHNPSHFTKQRISLIGKARATCGALNILRILSHETIVNACCQKKDTSNPDDGYYMGFESNDKSHIHNDAYHMLKESFTYKCQDVRRGGGVNEALKSNDSQNAALEVISSTLAFLSTIGKLMQQQEGNSSAAVRIFDILSIPEMYDVTVQILSLLLVLLSTQLYQPMVSSSQVVDKDRPANYNYFLEILMEYSYCQNRKAHQNLKKNHCSMEMEKWNTNSSFSRATSEDNEALLIVYSCLQLLMRRPKPPRRSIALHYVDLAQSLVQYLPSMTLAPDGMYENNSIAMATISKEESKVSDISSLRSVIPLSAPVSELGLNDSQFGKNELASSSTTISLGTDDELALSSPGHISGDITMFNSTSRLLLPIRSILLLSSSLFLLPIRLIRLAFHLIGHRGYHALLSGRKLFSDEVNSTKDLSALKNLHTLSEKDSGWNKTNNILWLTDSPIADLGCALVLLLTNNCRARMTSRDGNAIFRNPFHAELASLNDTRWGEESSTDKCTVQSSLFPVENNVANIIAFDFLSINFESLFDAFGSVMHTEVGALMLYTTMLSSPRFAASLAARSDLDTLVMPLLRTLYFSSKITQHNFPMKVTKQLSTFINTALLDRPFRSLSQLYVILILLLVFSQDSSFGRDSFKRVSILTVPWYKERQIKTVSLGSMIVLVLLKAIAYNLNLLHDEFLLSNCFAVLLNLGPHVIDLHDHVATRLISLTVSCFKQYVALIDKHSEESACELSTVTGMYEETCRTLLQLIKHSIRPKCVDRNLYLVYAILLEQADLQKMCNFVAFKQGDTTSIPALLTKANKLIQEHQRAVSAEETMTILRTYSKDLKSYLIPEGALRRRADSFDSHASDASDLGNLTFTYEEESDPEVFFVPYIWDVIVGVLTATTFEWRRDNILVFPLNDVDIPLSGSSSEFGYDKNSLIQNEGSAVHTPYIV